MKVLAVSSYSGFGGAEVHLVTFAGYRPPDVELEVLLLEDGPLAERLAAIGIRTRTASGYLGRPTARRLASFTRSFDGLLRRVRPDVVWAKGQKAALLCAPACRLRGVPVVWHKVDFSWDRELAMPLSFACNGVIGVSRAVLAELGPMHARRGLRAVGIPIRLPLEAASHPDPKRPLVGTLARLVPYKGLHHIIDAAAHLREEFPAVRVVMAGAPVREYPGYRDRLLELAQRRGMADRVELPGFVEDPTRLLESFTVFVSATYRDEAGFGLEGLAGAALEASWVGAPVVATRAGGTLEAVQDGRTGTLVESSAGLAPAIGAYLRDPELAARTGAAGRELARTHFTPEAAADRLYGTLKSVVARAGRGPGGQWRRLLRPLTAAEPESPDGQGAVELPARPGEAAERPALDETP